MDESPDLKSMLDRLYEANLPDFVKLRDELARDAKKAGNTEDSQRLKSAKKPTVVAAALNRLALRNRKQLEWLFEADSRVRKVLESGGGAAEVREANVARREIVGQLVDAATKHLSESGSSATPAVREKIGQLLYSMSTDPGLREKITSARLVKEPEPGEMELPASPQGRKEQSEGQKQRQHVESLEKELEELERSLASASDESSRLQDIAARAARAAEQAIAKTEKAARSVEEKRRQLEEARSNL